MPQISSPACEAAFPVAEALARQKQARLLILHVVPPGAVPSGPRFPQVTLFSVDLPARVEDTTETAKRQRQALERVVPRDPQIQFEHRLAEGDPGQTIVSVASEAGADLIVFGSQRPSGLKRLAGSVAESVVRNAPCPVLILWPALANLP